MELLYLFSSKSCNVITKKKYVLSCYLTLPEVFSVSKSVSTLTAIWFLPQTHNMQSGIQLQILVFLQCWISHCVYLLSLILGKFWLFGSVSLCSFTPGDSIIENHYQLSSSCPAIDCKKQAEFHPWIKQGQRKISVSHYSSCGLKYTDINIMCMYIKIYTVDLVLSMVPLSS